MKHLIMSFVFLILSNGLSNAQISKADRHFELFRYSKAIPLYKRLVDSNDRSIHLNATERLADCYRLTNNIPEARAWYSKAVEIDGADPINYYYLGQALRSMAFYKEAENAFNQFSKMAPDDFRGKVYAEYARQALMWEKQKNNAEIRNIQEINSKFSDFGPVMYKNGIVFSTDRKNDFLNEKTYDWTGFNYLNLYYTEPVHYKDFWTKLDNPVKMPNRFNQNYHDGPAIFHEKTNTIFITRTEAKSGRKNKKNIRTSLLKIFYGIVPEKGRVKYIPFPFNSESYSLGHPAINIDGDRIIFASDMPDGYGGTDLYISEKIDGKWSEPINLGPEINTFGNEVFPTWVNDSILYFSSDGQPGFGGLDIFQSKYSNGKWQKPINIMAPINSSYDDFSISFTTENNAGFFSSNRSGGSGADDIYAFRNFDLIMKEVYDAPPNDIDEVISTVRIRGYVKDKTTLEPLDKATIFVLNTAGNEALVLKTNEDGYYETKVEKDASYIIKSLKNGYFDDCMSFRSDVPDNLTDEIKLRDLLLDKYEVNKVFRIDNIYYDLDRWEIREDAQPALDNLISILKQYPISVELGSHTDSRASENYNFELSQKRAESAVRYMILQGISSTRITAKGYGESRLVNRCKDGVSCTEEEHQANRRTEFKITSISEDQNSPHRIDPDLFNAGEKVNIKLFDPILFINCL